MLISLNVKQMGIEEDMPTDFVLQYAHEYNFDAVCFDGLSEIPSQAALDHWKLVPGTMKMPMKWRNDEDLNSEISKHFSLIENVAKVGLKRMYTWLPYELGNDSWERYYFMCRYRLDILSSFLESYGIQLGVEPICLYQSRLGKDKTFITSYDGAQALTTDIDNMELCLDTYHIWASNYSNGFIGSLHPKNISMVHLSDAYPTPDSVVYLATEDKRRCPHKNGSSHQIVELLKEKDYQGIVSIECFNWLGVEMFTPRIEIMKHSFRQIGLA